MKIKVQEYGLDSKETEAIVKRAFYLAWKASGVFGMGLFQDRGSEMTEDNIWANIMSSGDYPGGASRDSSCSPYADYVFGRMMKLRLKFDSKSGEIELLDDPLKDDYQSWVSEYKDYLDLIESAVESIETDEMVK